MPTSMFNRSSFAAFLLMMLWLSGGAVALAGQRSVTLQPGLTNGTQIQVVWRSQSVVPAPGLQIFPDYQLHTSTDLTNWVLIGERLTGNIGGTNSLFSMLGDISSGQMAFFRLESIVELPGANLIGEDLAEADFTGGNLFGANLFAANLHHAHLSDADLTGADLRFANLTNADLSGASLFAAKVLSADLSFADCEAADLSFSNLDCASLF